MSRTINFLLCVAILGGLWQFAGVQSKLAKLRSEHDRLAGQYGVLDIKDPEKFYVKSVPTENEKDFLWRIYRPAGLQLSYRCVSGTGGSSSGSSTTSNAVEELFRIRFIHIDSQLQIHILRDSGASCSSMGDGKLNRCLENQWSKLEVETIADGQYSHEEIMRLLTIRAPPALVAELSKQKRGKRYEQLADTPMFEASIGTDKAYAKEEDK